MSDLATLQDLFVDEIRDLYHAEHQVLKALPKMARAATSPELRAAFQEHEQQTREHVSRLEQVFKEIGEPAKGKPCKGMQGIIEEGEELMKEPAEPEARDAGLIAAAQRVEHYEIAGYGTVRTFAQQLRHRESQELLQRTLDEEGAADKKLSKLALSHINNKSAAR